MPRRSDQPANPYRSGTLYNLIFSLLTGPRPLTRCEITRLTAEASGISLEKADFSVWVVVSPRECGRNPRGNRSSKGNLYYVTEDGGGHLQAHVRTPPLAPRPG